MQTEKQIEKKWNHFLEILKMNEYLIREAIQKDIPFLADIVIAAEKGNSDKLSFSTLFNLTEKKVKDLIIAMFDEEIDGCEFSLSSFLITECKGEPVAGFGAWIEGFKESMPSKILKSNLISYTFGKENMEYFKSKSYLIKDMIAERGKGTLQFEYLFVSNNHRGKRLADRLIQKHEENALITYPELKKAQVQLFKNNRNAINVYERNGFEILKTNKSDQKDIADYLPFNEKYIMEKKLIK